jgi:hypothetical protein
MLTELAVASSLGIDQRLVLFEKGKQNIEQALDRKQVWTTNSLAFAAMTQCNMGILQYFMLEPDMPPLPIIERSQQLNLALAQQLADSIQDPAYHSNPDRRPYKVASGALGRLSMVLLGHRHTTQEREDNSWLTVVSFYSQFALQRFTDDADAGWDLSIFEPKDGGRALTHKLRVGVEQTPPRDSGVTSLSVAKDLELDVPHSDKHARVTTVTRECMDELAGTGNKYVSRNLDRRTGQMLGVILGDGEE